MPVVYFDRIQGVAPAGTACGTSTSESGAAPVHELLEELLLVPKRPLLCTRALIDARSNSQEMTDANELQRP